MIFEDSIVNGNSRSFERLATKYTNESKKFLFQTRDYSKQFSYIYASRLEETAKHLLKIAKDRWKNVPIKKLMELREDAPDKCVIIGTLFKHQQLKPSILKEISDECQIAPQPLRENIVDDSDILILEDELQRIRLIGKIDVASLVTGVVCAVLGYQECDGRFNVEDHIFYESGPQRALPGLKETPLLVLMSGLDQSAKNDFSLSLALFQQWIYGNLSGTKTENDWEAASVVRIIIAGNSVRGTVEMKQKSIAMRQPETEQTLKAVKAVDDILAGWIKSVPVDLMPGEFDPSNYMLPQQPMHHCMLPMCSVSKNFTSVTNPYACDISGRSILGTSGQNVHDILRVSTIKDSLEALRQTLIWSHMAPTSPDTLPCYPYYINDPFVMTECPHVYFAGNTPHYQTELYVGSAGQRTRLVCIPSFSTSQSVVVVNLKTLDAKLISFKVEAME